MSFISSFVRRVYQFLKDLASEPLYPILFALYPILFLYQFNINELQIGSMYIPALVAIVVAAVCMLIGRYIFGNLYSSALLVGATTLVFYLYVPIIEILPHSIITILGVEVTRGVMLPPIVLCLLIAVTWASFKLSTHSLIKLSHISNIMAGMLVLTAIYTIGAIELQRLSDNHSVSINAVELNKESTLGYKPDIYYLIFDRYGGNKTFSQYYNYDNNSFIKGLKDRGFYIADESHANYPRTVFSLSASLNINYIQGLVDMDSRALSEGHTLSQTLDNHAVGQSLKGIGYTYFHLGNWYEITNDIEIADYNIVPDSTELRHLDDFTTKLLSTTLYSTVHRHLFHETVAATWGEQHLAWSKFTSDKLKEIVRRDNPKFVMSHMLMPHEPYVYNADCTGKPQTNERDLTKVDDYVQQLQCTNTIINSIVDDILKNSANPPIIVVQGDEGPEALVNKMADYVSFKDASNDAVLERSRVLNAYFFPDGDYSRLYRHISPVNSFRVVFDQFYGTNLGLIEEKYFVFPGRNQMFDFIDVTDIISRDIPGGLQQ